jgi:hypothetical protein
MVPRLRGKFIPRWQVIGIVEVCASFVHEGLNTKSGRGLPLIARITKGRVPAREYGLL